MKNVPLKFYKGTSQAPSNTCILLNHEVSVSPFQVNYQILPAATLPEPLSLALGSGVTWTGCRISIDFGRGWRRELAGLAEFETNLRKERQMEGIAKAKEQGVYKGRKPL